MSDSLFGLSPRSFDDLEATPITMESIIDAMKILKEAMEKPPEPEPPIIVNYKTFKRWVDAGFIDKNGNILSQK